MGDGASCGGCGNGGCSSGSSCSIPKQVQQLRPICIKCKESPAVAVANQTESICTGCLRLGVLSKVKTVLNTHALVTARDKLLIAFSGGASSRLLLQLLCEIRAAAAESRDLNAPAFALEAAFVDEGAALGASLDDRKAAVETIQKIVSGLGVPLHVLRLEDIMQEVDEEKGGGGLVQRCYVPEVEKGGGLQQDKNQGYDREILNHGGSDEQGVKKLVNLLSSVADPTGKEDLIEMLRMESLDLLARKLSFTKLILGWSTTRIAARVVSATAKGRGFSLAAGVQYVDARWHAPVVLPLRDCGNKELALLCHHLQLETLFLRNSSTLADSASATINSLCDSFVLTLKEDNSARDHTIVRTAGKLSQFGFNQLQSSRRKRVGGGYEKVGEIAADADVTLCGLCRDPLEVGEDVGSDPCCPSCRFQIVGDKQVFGLLPRHIQDRSRQDLLKSQIEEFLISEGEPAS